MNCLQRWAKDSISQQKMRQENDVAGYYNNQGEYVPKQVKPIRWACPKCRADYPPNDVSSSLIISNVLLIINSICQLLFILIINTDSPKLHVLL